MKRIAPGTEVAWESQSQGCVTTKRGMVLGFVPRGVPLAGIREVRDALRDVPDGRIKGYRGGTRTDRYVVAVARRSGVVDYYTPMATMLERQNQDALLAQNRWVAASTESAEAVAAT